MKSCNRLKHEKSLYLKQHQDDPIHWWAYGPEAINLAQETNRPIFLSIGFSSCHWCHVMQRESFRHQKTAEFLNQNFICIKVDREEFPDIDHYYQQACQLFSKNGGWPLNAFLLPDMRPFFVGTYFPSQRRTDETTFQELLSEIHRVFTQEPNLAQENASKVTAAIAQGLAPQKKVEYQGHFPPPMAVMNAIKDFKDHQDGGFGNAPKFPTFPFYEWAFEQIIEGMLDKDEAKFMLESFEKMLMGGLVDQLRGGIHRYSTDKQWQHPHFEKMLYNQAGLIKTLAKLGPIYPAPQVFDTLINTLDYLHCEMLSQDNLFFSAQDSESEGVEGLYFQFTLEEFEDALNSADDEQETIDKNLDKIKKWLGFENIAPSQLKTISLNPQFKEEFFTREGWELIRQAKRALLEERRKRIPPVTDSKGLASDNFMLLSALCDVVQYCQIDVIRNMANDLLAKSTAAIFDHFVLNPDSENIIIRHTTTKEFGLPYLEDFVFYAEANLRLYEVLGKEEYKCNLEHSLNFICKNFIQGDKAYTRALAASEQELYPNQAVDSFDGSFKAPVSTLMGIIRRASVLFTNQELLEQLDPLRENIIHKILRNPINSGEGLRALTYPDQIYRSINLPRSWLQNSKFTSFMSYFMPRFVFKYHDDTGPHWEICSLKECQLQGNGLDEFITTLTPAKPASKPETPC